MLVIDVALVPGAVTSGDPGVCIVIDQIRASTTLTTLLDAGCSRVFLAGDPDEARGIARRTGCLTAGEFHAVKPVDFDLDNSPAEIVGVDLRDRAVVLSTTNGTAVISRLERTEPVLVGCIRNARAVAMAACQLALAGSGTVRIVCAGSQGRFVLDDAVAAGLIVTRMEEAVATVAGRPARLSDGARASVLLLRSWPDLLSAMEASDGGATLRRIDAVPDIAFCAAEDATTTVPIVRYGRPIEVVRADGVESGQRPQPVV